MVNCTNQQFMKRLAIIFLLLPMSFFCQEEFTVIPSEVDANSGDPQYEHYIYRNFDVEQQNKLFLFLPGTGGQPFHYRELLKTAANLGYHSVGLSYPNSQAINIVCALALDSTCHSRARMEIFTGEDLHNFIDVDIDNCIETRLTQLLVYLDGEFPGEGWDQFIESGSVVWNKVRLGGHSQGGGHAAIIAKVREVDRVITMGSADRIPLLNQNADWVQWESETPEERYFGFAHAMDELVDFENVEANYQSFGIFNFGGFELVDGASVPYNNSHALYTEITPANDPEKYHNSIAVDLYTPMTDGVPDLLDTWIYLIGDGSTNSLEDIKKEEVQIYPNPFSSEIMVVGEFEIHIHDLQGRTVYQGLSGAEIELSHLNPGVYILNLKSENGESRSYRIVKN